MIATPLVDSKGPLAAYADVNKALQREKVFEEIPARRIFLKSPNDKVLKSLEKESRTVPREDFRVVNDQIEGSFVEEAYLYTGFISIAKLHGHADQPVYSVFYAPYEGSGGVAHDRRVKGVDGLRAFLSDSLHINREWIAAALQSLRDREITAIPNVQLRHHELKRLGLA